ncbi:hypothetical protein [Roseateles sp.]|uniref:hypothetical protein n=1 Tax=Roseateles sp. TaxID=1971397 RepID=UPI002F3F4877
MKIAILAAIDSFEAEIVGTGRRAAFRNAESDVRQFQRWALVSYVRGRDVELTLWEAEAGAVSTAVAQCAISGELTFRSWLPWRSANRHISVNHVAHGSAVGFSRRFGYDRPCLEAVVRRASGEFPFTPRHPSRVGEDMKFNALVVEETRGDGEGEITNFSIPVGREADAALELLALLAAGHEVSLSDDDDEGLEGLHMLKHSPDGLVMRQGGHGWSGTWQPVAREQAVETILSLAPLNRGGNGSACGSFSRARP